MRGDNNDENSNFMTFLKSRAEDVVELKSWLQRDGHKWLHHESQNEILQLMATTVLSEIMDETKHSEYFSISLDETSDVSRIEQENCLDFYQLLTLRQQLYSTSSVKFSTNTNYRFPNSGVSVTMGHRMFQAGFQGCKNRFVKQNHEPYSCIATHIT